MEALEQVKKRFNIKSIIGKEDFKGYTRTYYNTNENLKEYFPDLEGKSVLTVSSSGDHMLNALGKGAIDVDTFDVNLYSPLIQNLKLYSIKYLDVELSSKFLNLLDIDIYHLFNKNIPINEKKFFDYIFNNYTLDEIYYIMFYIDYLDNRINNNYFDLNILEKIKKSLNYVQHKHFKTNIYCLPNYINRQYDAIMLSNISQYANKVDNFLNFIDYLRLYLKTDGRIYFAYLYEEEISNEIEGIKKINPMFALNFEYSTYKELVKKIEFMNIRSAEYPEKKDSVLMVKK